MKDFTLTAMDEIARAFARDIIDAFGKDDVRAVYAKANAIAPKLYPFKAKLTSDELEKASELVADAYLLLGTKRH